MPLMAVLLLVALAESYTVTVYNPAKMLVKVLVDDKSLKVETDIMSLDLTRGEQSINFTTGQGDRVVSVDVKDGDVVVLVPMVVPIFLRCRWSKSRATPTTAPTLERE